MVNYNTCSVRFPKTIKIKNDSRSFKVKELYNSSLLSNHCPLFDELNSISNEMANGNRVKLD